MTAHALTWFEDDDPRDLRRWAMAAAIVLGIHLAAIAAYVYVHRPDEIGDDSSPVTMDLTPTDDTVDQPEVAPVPEAAESRSSNRHRRRPIHRRRSSHRKKSRRSLSQEDKPPTPAMPARIKGGAPQGRAIVADRAWYKHLQQFKRYPSDAQSRGEEGVVLLSFSVDRTGHVLAHTHRAQFGLSRT